MYDVEDAFWHKTYDMLYQKDKNIGFLLHEYGFSPDMEARGRSDGLCDIYLLANNDLYFPIVEDVKDEMDFVKKLPQAIWDWEMECYKIWNLDKDEYLSTSVCSPDNVVKHWISAAKPKSINNAFALYDKDVKEHMERLTACAEDLQVLGKFMELGINLYHESNELVLRELKFGYEMKFVPAGTEYNFRQFFDNVVGQDVDYTKKGFDSFLTAIASAKLLMKEKRENSEKGLLVPSGVGTILACYHKEPKPASKEEEEKDNPVEIVWDRSKFDRKKGRDR